MKHLGPNGQDNTSGNSSVLKLLSERHRWWIKNPTVGNGWRLQLDFLFSDYSSDSSVLFDLCLPFFLVDFKQTSVEVLLGLIVNTRTCTLLHWLGVWSFRVHGRSITVSTNLPYRFEKFYLIFARYLGYVWFVRDEEKRIV